MSSGGSGAVRLFGAVLDPMATPTDHTRPAHRPAQGGGADLLEEVYRQRTRGGGRNADCSGGGRIRAANVTLYLGALSRRPYRSFLGGAVVRVLDT